MLYESVVRTSELPTEDRFEAWVQRMGRTYAPMDLSSDRSVDYRAHQRLIELGEVAVWPATFDPLVFRRTPGLIRQSDPEVYRLSLLLRGEAGATWDRQEANYRIHGSVPDTARTW